VEVIRKTFIFIEFGGPEGNRTLDLLNAIQAQSVF
jgi:hypothetical protein